MKELKDIYNRRHHYLRISLTDKCNLNCVYCNPAEINEHNLRREDILSFEEIQRIVKIFSLAGFDKFRFTGGEPLTRKGIVELFRLLHPLKRRKQFELSITTNGLLLNEYINPLIDYGLDRVNLSIDSLRRDTYRKITGNDSLVVILKALFNTKDKGIPVKINSVIMRGINENELLDFCQFSIEAEINIRFIEFMPFSNNEWANNKFISSGEMKEKISKYFILEKINSDSSTARDYKLHGTKGRISFISSISEHFCSGCNRLRLTSDGKLQLCLFSNEDEVLDIKALLANEKNDNEIIEIIENFLQLKKPEHPSVEELIRLENNNMLKIGG